MAEETTTTTTETVDYKAEFEKMQNDYAKLKSNFDKTSSEVADYKRKERERMSEDEKRSAENAERETYYKELERKLAMKDYADELSDIADTKTKDNIVSLFADGKIVEALKAFKDFRAKDRVEMEKKIKAELLQQNPQANPQQGVGGLTKEMFDKMGVQERTKLYNEQPELYKKFTQ
jgi:hypothetical protein